MSFQDQLPGNNVRWFSVRSKKIKKKVKNWKSLKLHVLILTRKFLIEAGQGVSYPNFRIASMVFSMPRVQKSSQIIFQLSMCYYAFNGVDVYSADRVSDVVVNF